SSLAPSVRTATMTGRLFRVSVVIAVLLPESFRGGCSFGAAMRQSLPQSHRFASPSPAATRRESRTTLPEKPAAVTPDLAPGTKGSDDTACGESRFADFPKRQAPCRP